MERERVLNVPNTITALRIGLMGIFLWIHFAVPEKRELSMACFAAAGCTDLFDGIAARRLGQVTLLGKILDPLADKIMVFSALICLATSDMVPPWVTALVILKEMYMIAGAWALLKRRIVIPADIPGKISTFIFVPSVILIYPWHGVWILREAGKYLLYGSMAFSACAAVFYTTVAVKKSRSRKTD